MRSVMSTVMSTVPVVHHGANVAVHSAICVQARAISRDCERGACMAQLRDAYKQDWTRQKSGTVSTTVNGAPASLLPGGWVSMGAARVRARVLGGVQSERLQKPAYLK